jgi:hypothetical protein
MGRPIEITDVVTDLAEDPVLETATMLAGEQAGQTIEQVLYGVLKAGTNVFYANGAARNQVNTPITLNKQRAVVRALNAQKAGKITRILKPGVEYGTSAVEASFVAVAHTDLEADIRGLAGFVPVAKYGTRSDDQRARNRHGRGRALHPLAGAGSVRRRGRAPRPVRVPRWSRPRAPTPTCIRCCSSGRTALRRFRLRAVRRSRRWCSTRASLRSPTRWRSAATSLGRRTTRQIILQDLWMARLEVSVTLL